ncbi:LPXTG-motif cell wall-anchored protein [Parabacteroides sp. PFB2-12]|uniref:discoidin domain-containing protein n=1 Tax=unclassified Parabacteroides TaxID=2649774 RepID=UPI002476007A|nr:MULTISPECIES: discoidin domain-containing protein [unclassified Parabacteroides]MDH6343913.1 LPXTG-motif cell wall-anchored protein [Parabacteroides sp. PM6-13]MDH6391275.1 LPXTG-motif cell wall-anchored protein [Parabacteroides sp. PFB2-12]
MKKVSILLSMLFLTLSLAAQNNAETNKQPAPKVLSHKATVVYAKNSTEQWSASRLFSGETAELIEDHWAEKGPNPEFIIDLGRMCMISEFRIIDSKALRKNFPNISDYFIYVSETIDKKDPLQTTWTQVVNAVGQDEDYKRNSITPTKGRYVRFMAKLPAKDTVRLYRFEVWGDDNVVPGVVEKIKNNNNWIWISLLVLIVLAGGAFFFFKRKEFRI